MSGESAQHAALVLLLTTTIRAEVQHPREFYLLADHHGFANDRPPRIGGFTPDVFATDFTDSFRIIGEAKTPPDLQSQRSLRQIAAFLDHLALRRDSTFYLAVPWHFVARAQQTVYGLRQDKHQHVKIRVIGNMSRA